MGINFTSGSPVQYNGVVSGGLYESITLQTDASKILWYSNSHWVRDQNHGIMPGVLAQPGGKLKGAQGTADGSAVQGVVSFPYPGSTTRYVMVSTAAEDGAAHGLYYTDIDMTLPGNGTVGSPLGDLGTNIETNITPGINTTEMLGVYAPDCNNLWVVSHEDGTNRFVAVKFTSAGPAAPVTSNAGNAYSANGARGTLKVSPDGTKIATCGGSSGGIQIFDFNATTGVVSVPAGGPAAGNSNIAPVSGLSFGYSLEWSPNSRYVYIGGYPGFGGIRLYDTQTGAKSTVTAAGNWGDLQIGPDGVIYVAPQALGGSHLATITNPNNGPTASFNASGYAIGGSGGWFGLPSAYTCPAAACGDTSLASPFPAVCAGSSTDLSVAAYLNAVAAGGTWSIISSPPGGNANFAGSTFNAGTVAGNYVVQYDLGGGCAPQRTLVVNALPNVTLTLAPDNACAGAAPVVLAGGSPVGGTYTGTGVSGGNIDPAVVGSGNTSTVTYTFTDANNCTNAATDDFTINALPNVTLTLAPDNACAGAAPVVLAGGSPVGGTYTGTGVSGGNIDPTVVGSGNTSTVTYTFTDANNCTNTATDDFTINALPNVTLILAPDNACAGAAPVVLAGGSPVGGTYTGTGVSGGNIDPAVVGSGSTSTVTYTYTDANNCTNTATDDFTINVLPNVTLTLGTDAVCFGAGLTALTGGSPVGGVYTGTGVAGGSIDPAIVGSGNASTITYTYTDGNNCSNTATDDFKVDTLPVVTVQYDLSVCVDAPAFNLTQGDPSSGGTGVYSGPGISASPLFDPSSAGVGTHAVTYTFTDNNGCQASAVDNIVVNGLPVVTLNLAPDQYCVDVATAVLAGGNPLGGIYSGIGVNGSDFEPANAGVGSHTLTYTYTDAYGCVNSATDDMVVNDLPIVTLVLGTDAVCSDSSAFNLDGGSPAGGIYSGPGVGVSPSFDPTILTPGNHLITYTYTDANGCTNTATDSMKINDLPTVSVNFVKDSICEDGALSFLLGGVPLGGTYTGPGVTGGAFDPTAAGVGSHPITYTYTDANGCTNTATDNMRVDALPVVTLTLAPDNVCEGASALALGGGLPVGGTYTGSGVSNNQFEAGITGAGQFTITYTYTDINTCSNTATDDMTVNALPVVDFPTPNQVCVTAVDFALSGGTPIGGTYSGANVTANQFSPSAAGIGTHTVTYTYTDGNGCTNSKSADQIVNGLPDVNLGADRDVCDFKNADLTVPTSGANYSWTLQGSPTVLGTSQTYSTNQPGTYEVEVTDGNGCTAIGRITLTPGAMLTVDIGPDLKVCQGENVVFTVSAYDQILWDDNGTETTRTVNGADTVSVRVIDANGCWGVDTALAVLVPAIKMPQLREDTTICEAAGDQVLLEVSDPNLTTVWQDGLTGSTYTATFVGVYIATVSDSNGCSASDTVNLTDYCTPIGLTMPNVYTPNGDGWNDHMIPLEMEWADKDFMMANIKEIRFYVYDRWGLLVHATEGTLPKWDGKAPNGRYCSDGTYFWRLDYTDAAGNNYELSGFVKLYNTEN